MAATAGSNIGRGLLLGTGLVFLGAALLYDPDLVSALVPSWDPGPVALEKLRRVRLGFAAAGAASLALAGLVYRSPVLSRWLSRPRVATGLLGLLGLAVPLGLIDGGLRPFVEPRSSIFSTDPELGWKLTSGARDEYAGIRIEVNAKGLRGPELDYARRPDGLRILWLGDSVTFGHGIEAVEALFPWRVGALLSERLDRPLETVDAGVGGYAPWQERVWLEREGWRYQPDLVVVAFVLNDLTEPFALARRGRRLSGWQLSNAARSRLDRWLSTSALANLLREGRARLRFGRDVQRGAAAVGTHQVKRLVADPDAPTWEENWRATERDLAGIFASARAQGVPVALALLPYAFQVDAPEPQPAVQRRLAAFAERESVPVLDLLPALAADSEAQAFLDSCHLSAAGHALVAEALASFLVERALLPGADRQG